MNKHDFKIKGYIIEVRFNRININKDYWSNWEIHYNRKLYSTKEIAEEAKKYIGVYDFPNLKSETRIKPLYEINYEKNS